MKIAILCSDVAHPINSYLETWAREMANRHTIEILRKRTELTSGDFLFLVSCSEVIHAGDRDKYRHALVLHASDLPKGRGWSPHVWEIIQGVDNITLSLLEAEDKVDTGRVWLKRRIPIEKTALYYEINHLLFSAEIELINEALTRESRIKPYQQDPTLEPTYYLKRTPIESRIDAGSSLADQFNLIRVCDPDRYPAWFEMHGQKYKLVLEKLDDE